MSSNKRPNRKAKRKQTKRPVSRHTALNAHTGDPLLDANITKLFQAGLLDPEKAALLSFTLQIKQLTKETAEIRNMLIRAQNSAKLLLDARNVVDTNDPNKGQHCSGRFARVLPLSAPA